MTTVENWMVAQAERGRGYKARLVQLGVSQVDVAIRLGMDPGYLSKRLRGTRRWQEGEEEQFIRIIEEMAS